MRKEENTIEITEDVRVPGTDIILEKGDVVKIVEDRDPPSYVFRKGVKQPPGSLKALPKELKKAGVEYMTKPGSPAKYQPKTHDDASKMMDVMYKLHIKFSADEPSKRLLKKMRAS